MVLTRPYLPNIYLYLDRNKDHVYAQQIKEYVLNQPVGLEWHEKGEYFDLKEGYSYKITDRPQTVFGGVVSQFGSEYTFTPKENSSKRTAFLDLQTVPIEEKKIVLEFEGNRSVYIQGNKTLVNHSSPDAHLKLLGHPIEMNLAYPVSLECSTGGDIFPIIVSPFSSEKRRQKGSTNHILDDRTVNRAIRFRDTLETLTAVSRTVMKYQEMGAFASQMNDKRLALIYEWAGQDIGEGFTYAKILEWVNAWYLNRMVEFVSHKAGMGENNFEALQATLTEIPFQYYDYYANPYLTSFIKNYFQFLTEHFHGQDIPDLLDNYFTAKSRDFAWAHYLCKLVRPEPRKHSK